MNKTKTQAMKDLAELFLNQNKKVFIKDVNDSYYFADILFVGEDTIEVECYGPPEKAGTKFQLYWMSITKLEEAKR